MLTRDQVLERHSPAAWGLLAIGAICALELVGVIAWNAWDRRDQLLDMAVRALRP